MERRNKRKENNDSFSTKYHASGAKENEPGSQCTVLKNLLGITSKDEIDEAEVKGYTDAFDYMITHFSSNQQLSVDDINAIHGVFFGRIYAWAGKPRTVNLSKEGFLFPPAHFLGQSLQEVEDTILKPSTPCHGTRKEVIEKIARVHLELLFIHPYREGNGRTARLVATLMALQAGYSGFDWEVFYRRFDDYVKSIQTLDLILMCTLLDEALLGNDSLA
jgi:cell filamentation protein